VQGGAAYHDQPARSQDLVGIHTERSRAAREAAGQNENCDWPFSRQSDGAGADTEGAHTIISAVMPTMHSAVSISVQSPQFLQESGYVAVCYIN